MTTTELAHVSLSLISLLAWPAVVVVLIVILREPISTVLLSLKKVKFKGVELDLSKEFKENLEAIESTEGETYPGEVELTGSPTESVIQAWSKIVEAAEKKYQQLGPNQKLKNFAPDRSLAYFSYMGLLVPESEIILSELKNFERQATHYSNEVVSEESAKVYIKAAEIVRKQIEAINNIPQIRFSDLTQLLFQLHAAIDTGKHNDITIDDVHREIKNGNILRYVKKEVGKDIDFSMLLDRDNGLNFERHYVDHLQSIFNAYGGDERKRWHIKNSGLCLLAAWTLAIIQSGSGWQSNEDMA